MRGIPVWVRNDLPYPVTVTLLASPDDLRLDVQNDDRGHGAAPEQHARRGAGAGADRQRRRHDHLHAAEPDAACRSAQPQTAEVHVRADWEGIGIVILAVLVGGLVVLGLVRTILRRRSAPGATSRDAPDAAGREPARPEPRQPTEHRPTATRITREESQP